MDDIPHDYKMELAFLGQINHCNQQIHHAVRFQYDMMKHLYPHDKVKDRYMHVLLIPQDKTLAEGLMPTNASILEELGLLVNKPNCKYVLTENALKRSVFLYGDALTVCLYLTLYDKILQQITQLSNKEYVKILLVAQEHVFVQKGQFHQQMHLIGAIYTQFYDSFMQAFQMASGVKR
jgi:hypothetical protein